MEDFNDLAFFAAVVQHNGFTAAARATGIEKTRLSRRVAELEQRIGARLLHRSTRKLSLTEAGERFYERCSAAVESAHAAYDSVAELQSEPSGTVRLSSPVVTTQAYLAPILPGFLASHPKVRVFVDSTNRLTDLIEERFDMALRARAEHQEEIGLVGVTLGVVPRVLVASPGYLKARGHPETPSALPSLDVMTRMSDMLDGASFWELTHEEGVRERVQLHPRLASDDIRVQLEAAISGMGLALLPEPIVSGAVSSGALERVLPRWSAAGQLIHLVYPQPRGLLPSVRSLIDYLKTHLPPQIERNLM